MFLTQSAMRRIFSAIAATGCLLTGIQTITSAQSTSGLTLFSGVERQNQLNYRLDYGSRNMWDRYRLRMPASKMPLGVSQIQIDYPDYYNGEFDQKQIEVRLKSTNKTLPLQAVNWDRENRKIQIDLKEPLTEGKDLEVVLNNVKNGDSGFYYFNCRIRSPIDIPVARYVGTWIVTIDQ